MNLNVKIGQTLWTITGETVAVCEIAENKFCVRYKGQKVWREKSILGIRLFDSKDNALLRRIKISDGSASVEKISKDSCDNCMLMRREECFGEKSVCDLYQHVPDVSKEEIDSWPKE